MFGFGKRKSKVDDKYDEIVETAQDRILEYIRYDDVNTDCSSFRGLCERMLNFYNRGDKQSYIRHIKNMIAVGYKIFFHDFVDGTYVITIQFIKDTKIKDVVWLEYTNVDEHMKADSVLNKFAEVMKESPVYYRGTFVLEENKSFIIVKRDNDKINIWTKHLAQMDINPHTGCFTISSKLDK